MEKAIQLADDLGVRSDQLAGYDVYCEEGDAVTLDCFIKTLRKLLKWLHKKGPSWFWKQWKLIHEHC